MSSTPQTPLVQLGNVQLHIMLIGLDANGKVTPIFKTDTTPDQMVEEAANEGLITGNKDEVVYLKNGHPLLVVGMGSIADTTPDSYRHAAGTACGWLRTHGKMTRDAGIIFNPMTHQAPLLAQLLAEGWTLRNHSVKRGIKARAKEVATNDITLVLTTALNASGVDLNKITEAIERGILIGKIGQDVRNIGNRRTHVDDVAEGSPVAVCSAILEMIKRQVPADQLAKIVALPVNRCITELPDDDALLPPSFYEQDDKGKRWGAFLSVAKGAKHPPAGLLLKYSCGKPGAKLIALLGKLVCYDTGGYSLKISGHMLGMHMDKMGGVNLAGLFAFLVASGVQCDIIFMVNGTENLPDTRPGDGFTCRNGDIETNNNTDAEGRLTLKDGVDYLIECFGPDLLLDAATLTGAAVAALGGRTALFTSEGAGNEYSQSFAMQSWMHALQPAGLGFWPMPTPHCQADLLAHGEFDGKQTDLTAKFGCGTAALYLMAALIKANEAYKRQTVGVHADIAGAMEVEGVKTSGYRLPGASPETFIGFAHAFTEFTKSGGRYGISPDLDYGC